MAFMSPPQIILGREHVEFLERATKMNIPMRSHGRRAWCALLLGASAMGAAAYAADWPAVKPVYERHTFIAPGKDGSDTPFVADVLDTGGAARYRLECHNPNYRGDPLDSYAAYFQCRLQVLQDGKRVGPNLLAADTPDEKSQDWWNRGRLRLVQLLGQCITFPEYSMTRHFRLRGMLLTLEFSDVEWSPRRDRQGYPLVDQFTVVAQVVPDETAQTAAAEPAQGDLPPKFCYP
jgi:hypothetical protein